MAEYETVERFGYRQELARRLGLGDMVGYGLIYMVPIAPFAIFGAVYASSGGMPALAYLAGGVALWFTANSYQQMARAFPLAGSVYSYAGRAIGAPVGFFAGWAILLDYILVPALLYLVALTRWSSPVDRLTAATARMSVTWRRPGTPAAARGQRSTTGGARDQRRAKTRIELTGDEGVQ